MGIKCQLWIGTSTRDSKKGLGSYFKHFWTPYDTLRPFPQKVPNWVISGLLLLQSLALEIETRFTL